MIIRIVRMYFKPEEINNFLEIFNQVEPKISSFKGCIKVKLLSDFENPNCLLTYSEWNSNEDLQLYRSSELFKNTWSITKILFAKPPQAFSMCSYPEEK